ncbi:MAG: malP [Rhodospirillales bacterium]|nr:malP [Rhodospirillales bacterium]
MDMNSTNVLGLPHGPERGDTSTPMSRVLSGRVLYETGKDPAVVSPQDWLLTVSHVARDKLVERWIATGRRQQRHRNPKRAYYLSMEFLPGRALGNALFALGLYDSCREALIDLGHDVDEVRELEPDQGLGNGGLGRLAACFLDSMASLDIPGMGYGIRYEYGMFAQRIQDGRQVEHPDPWLAGGNPWEFPRREVTYRVQFGGRVERIDGAHRWVDTDDIKAMAYDTLIPGHGTQTVNALRLWSAKALTDIDLPAFNEGDHVGAVDAKSRCEAISRILYPGDGSAAGRELRLKQEFFFVSASLQDLLHRFIQENDDFDLLPEKVAIHLNDTHPALAVPELMRLLMDVHGLEWERAWNICRGIFSYTNHTLLPEALETWPVHLMEALLPRHLAIIYEINELFLRMVRHLRGEHHNELFRNISLIDEAGERRVRMGHLCVLASHTVNGVSKLHSELMQQTTFADFATIFPDRFTNQTNGITPRRWLEHANPGLSGLIDSAIGPAWRRDLCRLQELRPHADDAAFRAAFRDVKLANKKRLRAMIQRETGVVIDPDSLVDVQVKRIHEFKRQLLNILRVVADYNRLKAAPAAVECMVPRTVLFAGKAAPGYWMAKLIIKLINDVSRRVNEDPRLQGKLKVVFVPNYCVSAAEVIIPGADLSEQISMAGTEASGTGNMKLSLNGALTIGTEDGANIEIRDEVGAENIFIFGHLANEVREMRKNFYEPRSAYQADPVLREVIDQVAGGAFSPDEPGRFQPIIDALLHPGGDRYMVLADFAPYLAAQRQVDLLWQDRDAWSRKAILNVAGMGVFSSDRTILGYAEDIWGVRPIAAV